MESVNELINELGDKSRRIRQKAEKALVQMGKPAVEPLINALEDENWRVRWRAADALGIIGEVRAIEPLIRSFSDCQRVQIRAGVALGKIGKPAVEPLLQVLDDDNWEIREGAVMALGAGVRRPVSAAYLLHCLVQLFLFHARAAQEITRLSFIAGGDGKEQVLRADELVF